MGLVGGAEEHTPSDDDDALETAHRIPHISHSATSFRRMVVSAVLDIAAFGLTILPGTQLCMAMSDGTTAGGMEVLMRVTVVMLLTAWLVSPGLGDLSDCVGRKPVLVLLRVGRLLNIVAAMVLIHLAQTEQMAPKDVQIIMYGTYVLAGVCEVEVTAHTYYAVVTDLYAQEHRAGQIGVLSAAMGVAVTLAQLLDGAVLDAISPLQAFALAATLAAVSLAYTVAAFRETLDRTHATRRSPRSRQEVMCKVLNPVRDVVHLLRDAAKHDNCAGGGHVPMSSLALVYFVEGFNHQLFLTTLVFYLESQYRVPTSAAAPVFMFAAILASAEMMLVKRIVARLGDVRTCCLALSVNIVGALILAFSFTLPLYFLGLVPWSFHMMLVPCLSSAASRQVGPDKQGLLFGALGSIKSLALLCGALLGGTIYSTLQRAGIDAVPGAHYLAAAAMSSLGLAVMARAARRPARRHDVQHTLLLPSDAVQSDDVA